MLILFGSIMPSASVPEFNLYDKAVHLFCYALLSLLLFVASLSYSFTQGSVLNRWLTVLFLGNFLGIGVEMIQHILIPSRYGDLMDVIANNGGILLALLIAEFFKGHDAL